MDDRRSLSQWEGWGGEVSKVNCFIGICSSKRGPSAAPANVFEMQNLGANRRCSEPESTF